MIKKLQGMLLTGAPKSETKSDLLKYIEGYNDAIYKIIELCKSKEFIEQGLREIDAKTEIK